MATNFFEFPFLVIAAFLYTVTWIEERLMYYGICLCFCVGKRNKKYSTRYGKLTFETYRLLMKSNLFDTIQLVFQFLAGQVPACIYTPIMDVWDKQNRQKDSHFGFYYIKHEFTRFAVIVLMFISYTTLCRHFWRPTKLTSKRLYRKAGYILTMLFVCCVALNDNQLNKAFVVNDQDKAQSGYTPQYYRDVLMGVGIVQGLALVSYIFWSVEAFDFNFEKN